MTATTKPVYRWEPDCDDWILKIHPPGKPIAIVDKSPLCWRWRKFGDNRSGPYETADAAKAACEIALHITTEPEVAKGQEDKGGSPSGKHLKWTSGTPPYYATDQDGNRVGTVYEQGVGSWQWRRFRMGVSGAGCASVEQAIHEVTKSWLERPGTPPPTDQPPVIIPPNGLADALDAHAAKVAEEDAEARHASAMADQPSTCPKRNPLDEMDLDQAAKILSVYLGRRLSPLALRLSLELAGEV